MIKIKYLLVCLIILMMSCKKEIKVYNGNVEITYKGIVSFQNGVTQEFNYKFNDTQISGVTKDSIYLTSDEFLIGVSVLGRYGDNKVRGVLNTLSGGVVYPEYIDGEIFEFGKNTISIYGTFKGPYSLVTPDSVFGTFTLRQLNFVK